MDTFFTLLGLAFVAAIFFAAGHQSGIEAERGRWQGKDRLERRRFLEAARKLVQRIDQTAAWREPGAVFRILRQPIGAPSFARLVEAFFPLPSTTSDPLALWREYVRTLRNTVAPLIAELSNRALIDWYCFLVHETPLDLRDAITSPTAIHFRFTAPDRNSLEELVRRLDSASLFPRLSPAPDLTTMDTADVTAVSGGGATNLWLLLAEASRLSLLFLCAHRDEADVPSANIAQLAHYMENQLQLKLAGIKLGGGA